MVPFGLAPGLLPSALYLTLPTTFAWLEVVKPVVAYALLASFLLGLLLLVLALVGLEHHQAFAALGFRHFVRLCVHPSGRIEGFVIGKDDPLGEGPPVLIDRFVWD